MQFKFYREMDMFADSINSIPSSYSIGDNVYYTLLINIVNLNLKPGEPLNVKSISEQLNVSRTPVRDAFIKLAKEGLVDVFPQKGTSVSKIDLRRVQEEQFLRQSLEVRAVTIFMQEHQPSHLGSLAGFILKQIEALETKDYLSCLQYDDEFHHVFFDAIDKSMCWNAIQSFSGHYRRVRLMSIWDHDIFAGVIEQHRHMLENIEAGNIDRVRELFLEHSSKLVREVEALSDKYPEYFMDQIEGSFLLKDFLRR
ncbi:MAG: GntR family transcriptional regulator [Thermoclostridium sp.]|nr:GntR family transcriptional regulator [Thermoclostridium sp.]